MYMERIALSKLITFNKVIEYASKELLKKPKPNEFGISTPPFASKLESTPSLKKRTYSYKIPEALVEDSPSVHNITNYLKSEKKVRKRKK